MICSCRPKKDQRRAVGPGRTSSKNSQGGCVQRARHQLYCHQNNFLLNTRITSNFSGIGDLEDQSKELIVCLGIPDPSSGKEK